MRTSLRHALEVSGGLAALGLSAALLSAVLPLLPTARAAETGTSSAPPQTPKDPAAATGFGRTYDSDAALLPRAEPTTSYTLEAKLDAERHVIKGRGQIVWQNRAEVPVSELWLHLYLNAFKNDRTLFLRSPFGAGRSGNKATDWGYIDVERLWAKELGADLWPGAERTSPGDPDDQTDVRVPLPIALAPGRTLTLEIEFTAKLPAIVERTGYAGSYHFAGQWFPKLAKLEPDGTWVHFAFHPQSEFYADFGRYSVTLDVPEAMRVGATGVRVDERVAKGRRIVRHEIESVHDFAWTAWDQFEETRARIDGVDVVLLFPPGHAANASLTLDTLRFALPHFSKRYGRYPYPVLTVVHPPESAENSGGMEYPTLITTGGPWYLAYSGIRAIEAVTIHELGHQWFYGLVATNEHAWPFLDEGLTTYVEGVAMTERFGAGSLIDWPSFELSGDAFRRALAAEYGQNDVVASPAAAFANFGELGALVYSRTGTILQTIERVYGKERLLGALGRYARRYRFQHPSPKGLVAAVSEVVGADAAAVLQQALFERGWVDYRVDRIESAPAIEPAGVFDRDGTRKTLSADTSAATERWVGRITVRRDGTLRIPVDVELVLEDGTRQRRRWDGQTAWTALSYEGKSPVVSAHVDPEERIPLDDNLWNNAKTRTKTGSFRLSERGAYAVQLLLGLFGP